MMIKLCRLFLFYFIVGLPFFSSSQNSKIINAGNKDVSASDSTSIDSLKNEDNLSVNIQDINSLLNDTEKLIKKSEGAVSKKQWESIDTAFSKKEIFIEQEYEYFNTRDKQNLSKFFLTNTGIAWSNYRVQIQKWQSEIDNQIALSIKNLNLFRTNKQSLEKIHQNIINTDFPALTKRVESVI